MANQEGNYLALKEATNRLLRLFNLEPHIPDSGRQVLEPFQRVWIPNGEVVTNGNGLGCYAQLPRVPNEAIRVNCGKSFTLTLDTEWTTPQAILGVKFGSPPASRTDCVVLMPGDTLDVPSGFDKFWVFAADNLDLYTGETTPGVVGYVSFLTGRHLGARPHLRGPHPKARVLSLGGEGDAAFYIPSPNVKAIRATLTTEVAGGVIAKNVGFAAAVGLKVFDRDPVPLASVPLFAAETPDVGTDLPGYGAALAEHWDWASLRVLTRWQAAGIVPHWDPLPSIVLPAPGRGILSRVFVAYSNVYTGGPIVRYRMHLEAVDPWMVEQPPKRVVIYDFTTPANTALDTGIIPCVDLEFVAGAVIFSSPTAAPLTLSHFIVSDWGSPDYVQVGTSTVAAGSFGTVNPIASYFRDYRFTLPAAGAGITTRLVIVGVRGGL